MGTINGPNGPGLASQLTPPLKLMLGSQKAAIWRQEIDVEAEEDPL